MTRNVNKEKKWIIAGGSAFLLGYLLFFTGRADLLEKSGQTALIHAYQEQGRSLMRQLASGSVDMPQKASVDYNRDIIALIWYLDAIAAQKGQSLREGMYVIEDPEERLLQFLKGHPHVYERHSSHFPRMNQMQYGIDVVSKDDTTLLLPHGNRHILFGNTSQKGYIFIEPERNGTQLLFDFVLHAHSYVRYCVVHTVCPWVFEYDGFRHELVPHTVVRAWNQLHGTLSLETNPTECKTINEMVKAVNHMSEKGNLTAVQRAHLEKFNAVVKRYDCLNVRSGREVIITQDDIKKSAITGH